MAYFKDHCARCHLNMGAGYPDDFTKGQTIGWLRDEVKSMAAGQGGAPLSDQTELEAQVAFHYAIDLKKPFLTWTGQDGTKLVGEVTPGAKVSAQAAGASVPVTVDKGVWTVVLATSGEASKIVLTAKVGETQTTLDLAKSPFSRVTPALK